MKAPTPSEEELLQAWQIVTGLIASNPKRLAEKTRVENALMAMYDIDRETAHTACNFAQAKGLLPYHPSGEISGSKMPWANCLYKENTP